MLYFKGSFVHLDNVGHNKLKRNLRNNKNKIGDLQTGSIYIYKNTFFSKISKKIVLFLFLTFLFPFYVPPIL